MNTIGSKRPLLNILAAEVELWKYWSEMSTNLNWQQMDIINRLGNVLCSEIYGFDKERTVKSWHDLQNFLHRLSRKK